jgi:hypothetical protein
MDISVIEDENVTWSGILTLANEDTVLLLTVRIQLPIDTVSFPRRVECSFEN